MNKYLNSLSEEASRRCHFAISLSSNTNIPEVSKDELNFARSVVLARLMRIAVQAKFYWRSAKREIPMPKPSFVKEGRNCFELSLHEVSIEGTPAFWEWVLLGTLETGGNLLLMVPSQDFPMALSNEVWDATVYQNLGALISKSAISYAKKLAKTGETVSCIFFATSTQIGIAVVGNEQTSSFLFVKFAQECRYRDKHEAFRRGVDI